MTSQPNNLYDLPLYYDIAFSWSLSKEADFLIRAIKWHGRLKQLDKVLEPACGTGRMLREFAQKEICITGYDISEPSVDFAIKRSRELKLDKWTDVLCADMTSAKFDTPFDGAFSLVGSFTYLLDEQDIADHLEKTAENLKDGAVYIIQMSLTGEGERDYPPQTWTGHRGSIEVEFTWGRESRDIQNRINHDYSVMKVNDDGKELTFREQHPQRMWTPDEFKNMIDSNSHFKLDAIYDIKQKTVPLDRPDLDMLHIPYFILKRT